MGAKLIVLGVAFTVTFALTPVVRRLAERYGAVVAPDERRVHSVPTATIGGTPCSCPGRLDGGGLARDSFAAVSTVQRRSACSAATVTSPSDLPTPPEVSARPGGGQVLAGTVWSAAASDPLPAHPV